MGRGVTLNVSRSGALVQLEERESGFPETGNPIELEILLPGHGAFEQRCMACDGEVMRESGNQVALQFYQVRFREPLDRKEKRSAMRTAAATRVM